MPACRRSTPCKRQRAGWTRAGSKREFGADLTFWGGGAESQTTLPNGTPEQIAAQVRERMEIFAQAAALSFTPVHNIQADVPPENIVAVYDAANASAAIPNQGMIVSKGMTMSNEPFLYVGADVSDRLARFARQEGLARFTLVADERTQAAFGAALQEQLAAAGLVVTTVILAGAEVVADERYLVQVFLRADPKSDAYLAVGSGTITDIVRFVCDRNRRPFISVPTAPSVDGFTSSGAPLIIGGFKQTVEARMPLAVIADLHTLCTAPRPMIAAGLGDMLGKYTSLADWQLGHLLWNEPYNAPVAARTQKALQNCVARAGALAQASPEGIETLMEGLVESGLSIAGSRALASGLWSRAPHLAFLGDEAFAGGTPGRVARGQSGGGLACRSLRLSDYSAHGSG